MEINVGEDEIVPVGGQLGVIGAAGPGSSRARHAAPPPPRQAGRPSPHRRRRRPPPRRRPPRGTPTAPRHPRLRPRSRRRPHPRPPRPPSSCRRDRRTHTSLRSYASSPRTTTSIWRTWPAPASAGGSANRTCLTPPGRRAGPRRPPRRPPAAPGRLPPHAAAPAAAASPLRGRTEKISRLRKVIAQRMVQSLQVSAQLTTVLEVDVTRSRGCGTGSSATSRRARA